MSTPFESTVAISLTCKSASDALAFYARAFNARELYRISSPNGGVGHAEFMIGGTRLFISDEAPPYARAMPEGTMASCVFSITTDDCDQAFQQAVAAGAKALTQPRNFFWGARNASVCDPFGYRWSFAQKVEDLTPEEIGERAKKFMAGGA